jgi:hypothetical protein
MSRSMSSSVCTAASPEPNSLVTPRHAAIVVKVCADGRTVLETAPRLFVMGGIPKLFSHTQLGNMA